MYEKKSRFRNFIIGAVVIGAGLAAGIKYHASLRKAEAHFHHSIDNHLENSPRLNRVMEVLSYPTKEFQKCLYGWSEEEYRRNEQEYRDNIERIVHEGETK